MAKSFVSISVLALLICALLIGCRADASAYYASPKKAYLAKPIQIYAENQIYDSVDDEIDCIKLSDSEVLWLSVVNDDHIVGTFMEVKDGSYRMGGQSAVFDYADLESETQTSAMEDFFYYSYTLASEQTFYWALTLTHALPDDDQVHEYTVKSYTAELGGKEVELSLVYYTE